MFHFGSHDSRKNIAFSILSRIFNNAVHSVRKNHGNAVIGLILNVMQSIIMVMVFFVMFRILGVGRVFIRGDFMLYIMSGIFMFMTQSKTLGAIVAADGPTSPMMKHAPMTPLIAIAGAALSTLYIQVLSAALILLVYHIAFNPITIYDPAGALGMLLVAWGTGIGIGLLFKAALPWQPDFFGLASQVYQRADMIASGKMFLANATPAYILGFFTWNPLFHTIDQSRGFLFANYHPRHSSIEYPIMIMLICICLGTIGEFYTSRRASLSWSAKH